MFLGISLALIGIFMVCGFYLLCEIMDGGELVSFFLVMLYFLGMILTFIGCIIVTLKGFFII